jgi:hypothetical protein
MSQRLRADRPHITRLCLHCRQPHCPQCHVPCACPPSPGCFGTALSLAGHPPSAGQGPTPGHSLLCTGRAQREGQWPALGGWPGVSM